MSTPIELSNVCPANETGHEPEQIDGTDASARLALGVRLDGRLGEMEVCACKYCGTAYVKSMVSDSE